MVDLFPKCWNWQICQAHWAFKLPLRTFSGKLRTFPMVKSKTIGFLLDLTHQYTPVLFAKTPRELLPEKELLSGHYGAYSEVAARDSTNERFENCWKCLTERCLVLQACVLHHASVEKSKDETERCCKDETERCCKDQYKSKLIPRY